MFSKYSIFYIGFIAICSIQSAYSIKCYRCESRQTEECGEKFNSGDRRQVDCADIPKPRVFPPATKSTAKCSKIIIFDDNNNTYIERDCFWEDEDHNKCMQSKYSPNTIFKSCETCENNLCNQSSIFAPFGYFLLISIVIFLQLHTIKVL